MALGDVEVRQKFGRPQLQDMLDRQAASNITKFVAQRLLRASTLLQLLPFDDTAQVNPRTRMITYPYKRSNVQRVAQLRDYNTDYKPAFSGGETEHIEHLRPIGDAFEIDRVFGDADPTFEEEQVDAMAPAIAAKVADLAINGDRDANPLEPNGLSKILEAAGRVETGLTLAAGDWGTAAQLAARRNLTRITAEIRRIRGLGLNPVVLVNADAMTQLETLAAMFNAARQTDDAFGITTLTTIDGAPIVDVGVTNAFNAADVTTPPADGYRVENPDIIPTVTGVTDIYVVGMSRLNGFTGVTVNGKTGTAPVRYATQRTDAGVLRRTELEVVCGFALLDERAAIKFSDVAL
jgi:hypothetical protein